MKKIYLLFFVFLFVFFNHTNHTSAQSSKIHFSEENSLGYENYIFLYNFFSEDTSKINYFWTLIGEGLDRLVVIRTKTQELFLLCFSDVFEIFLETKISSGLKTGWTPTGFFIVSQKRLSRSSVKYGGVMTYWNCITPNEAIAIHSLKDPGYEVLLGQKASHGCIRISKKVEETLYKEVPIGTLVLIE